jgi:midasin (ATPase involved in ribosome maturation)
LEGPPGIGKTAIIEELAEVLGYKCVRISLCDSTTTHDLFGSGGLFKGIVIDALEKNHWLLFDEINLATPSVLEALSPLLDPASTQFRASWMAESISTADVKVFATMNPQSVKVLPAIGLY